MSKPVKFSQRNHIAVVLIDHPPMNLIDRSVREGLAAAFESISGQSDLKAVVLAGEGRGFPSGADIREYAKPIAGPTASEVATLIENCPLPVVAALHGSALGVGLEIALAAHYRLASAEARLGFPDATLGLVPGAGGTQRLPRITGAEAALNLLLGARPVGALAARDLGLVDAIVTGDLLSGAINFAEEVAGDGSGVRPTSERREGFADPVAYQAAVEARRAAMSASRLLAPRRIVDCVEAAMLLPFEAGLAFEATAFQDCLSGDQSAALRHVFYAERRISGDLLDRNVKPFRPAEGAGTAVVERLQAAMRQAADHLVQTGRRPEEIDAAACAWGFLIGPYGERLSNGAAADAGVLQRRLLGALVAEGGRLVEEGLVSGPWDIDALAVHGLGFPRWLGGPMKAAELGGLLGLRRDLVNWSADDAVWTPPALLSDALPQRKGFAGPV